MKCRAVPHRAHLIDKRGRRDSVHAAPPSTVRPPRKHVSSGYQDLPRAPTCWHELRSVSYSAAVLFFRRAQVRHFEAADGVLYEKGQSIQIEMCASSGIFARLQEISCDFWIVIQVQRGQRTFVPFAEPCLVHPE